MSKNSRLPLLRRWLKNHPLWVDLAWGVGVGGFLLLSPELVSIWLPPPTKARLYAALLPACAALFAFLVVAHALLLVFHEERERSKGYAQVAQHKRYPDLFSMLGQASCVALVGGVGAGAGVVLDTGGFSLLTVCMGAWAVVMAKQARRCVWILGVASQLMAKR